MQAEALLEQMLKLRGMGYLDVKPDKITFSAITTAWANSRDPSAGKRTEQLLEQMQEQYETGNIDVKLNTISCNAVITAWLGKE